MSIHKHSSWGRTRRPKGTHRRDAQRIWGGSSLPILRNHSGSHDPDLSSAVTGNFDYGVGVYPTENQRYMHIHCSGSESGVSNVYAYMSAARCWAEYKTVNPTDGTRDAVTCSANEHIVVEIYGVDAVAFNTASSNDLSDVNHNYVAFNTF